MDDYDSYSDEDIFAEQGSSSSLLGDMPRAVTPEIIPSPITQLHANHIPLEVGTGEPQLVESPAEERDWYLLTDEIKRVQKSLENLSTIDVPPVGSKEEAVVTEFNKEPTSSEIQTNGKAQSDPGIKEEKPVIYPRTKIRPIPKQRPFSSQDNISPVPPIIMPKDLALTQCRSITVSAGNHGT